MPRSLWSGSLSFGLVNVPVQLVTAVQDQKLRFRQLHERTHQPVEVRRFCSADDAEVPYEDVAHGFELEDGEGMVVVTDEDLETVEPRKTRTIEVDTFVPLADVDPVYFDHPYVLLPIGDSEGTLRAYRLLVEVMRGSDRAALGRFVMRTKEYLVLVRARGDRLALTTLLWHDEVRPRDAIAPGGKAPAKALAEQTVALIEAMTVDWDPSRYDDRYRSRLTEVIERKREGGTVKAPTAEKEPAPTPDLMAALEATLAEMKGRKSGAGGGSGSSDKARLEDLSKQELLDRAAEEQVTGRSKMTKEELVDALS